MTMDRKAELLAPAGSYEAIIAAAAGGADAVYVGGGRFGARAFAKNLTQEELMEAMDYLHLHGKRMYLTVNTLLKDRELNDLYDYIAPLYEHGLDAVIVQDIGVMAYLKEQFPQLHLHVSTQMTITNLTGALAVQNMGADRVVLARELSLEEISSVSRGTDLEIEVFIHGALCYCYSGECLMSSVLGGRSGNRGRCAQPCRLPYDVNGQGVRRKNGCYILSPRDICTIDYLPQLLDAGAYSLKIEGRMKRPEYTYGVVKIYRKYLDMCLNGDTGNYCVSEEDRNLLEKLYTRSGFSCGYLKEHNGPDMMTLSKPDYITSDEAFYRQLKNEYDHIKLQEKIKGSFTLSKGQPAHILVEYEDRKIESTGSVVPEALTAGADPEKIKAQLSKTGNSPFLFESLEVDAGSDAFLPVGDIKALRRDALEQLEQSILAGYRRDTVKNIFKTFRGSLITGQGTIALAADTLNDACSGDKAAVKDEVMSLCASVCTWDQAWEVLKSGAVSDIYLEEDLLFDRSSLKNFIDKAHKRDIDVYGMMPYIFREKTAVGWEMLIGCDEIGMLDGMIARSVDELGFLKGKEYGGHIRCDYSLYVMNTLSAGVFSEKYDGFTYSPELKYQELYDIAIKGGELYGYGYIPLMISAQCIGKNLGSCNKDNGTATLKDRYNKEFTVKKDCRNCQNLIYNCVPITLLGVEDKVRKVHASRLRLSFTMENAALSQMILKSYEKAFIRQEETKIPMKEYTRGHFQRGVE